MKNIINSRKRILGVVVVLSASAIISILGYACSPVKFSQGTKNQAVSGLSDSGTTPGDSTSGSTVGDGTGSGGTSSGTTTDTTSGTTSGGGDPFDLVDPITHEHFTFTSIDQPYQQTEFNSTVNDDDVLNYNYNNFTYNSNGTCSVSQIKYEYDPTVDNPGTYADLFPPITSTLSLDQSKAACKAADIAAKIKTLAGSSCTATTNALSASEFARLNTIKLATPKSGGDAAYILLEASLLQSSYANIDAPTISIDANCRCFYTFKRYDENSVNIMGLQEHCAAHFSRWNY